MASHRSTVESSEAARGRTRHRRWCIPPAIEHDPEVRLDGLAILQEDTGNQGVLLWQIMRDVRLWASAPVEHRGELFTAQAGERREEAIQDPGLDPVLRVALQPLTRITAEATVVQATVVAGACLEVARWARARGRLETALEFAQAAAQVDPERAMYALEVGQIAVQSGRTTRGETWLRRAVWVARRAGDWTVYAWGYVHLGELYEKKGELDQARRHYLIALNTGRRRSVLEVRGVVLHGLLRLAIASGDVAAAETFAAQAQRVLGRNHPRTPAVVRDLASMWIARGEHNRALPLLRRLPLYSLNPRERMQTCALIARAAAGTGERGVYTDAWVQAYGFADRVEPESAARALLELAKGAALLRDGPRLDEAGRYALERAGETGDRGLVELVRATLTTLGHRDVSGGVEREEPVGV